MYYTVLASYKLEKYEPNGMEKGLSLCISTEKGDFGRRNTGISKTKKV